MNDKKTITCFFCGKDFEPEDILFCDFSGQNVTDPNYDKAYQAFLEGIISFDRIQLQNGDYIEMQPRKKCYFHPWSNKNRKGKPFNQPLELEPADFDLYPDVIRVIRNNGFTPDTEAGLDTAQNPSLAPQKESLDPDGEATAADSDEYALNHDEDTSMFVRGGQETNVDEPAFSQNAEARIRTKACPHCHCFLPENIGRYPTHRIVMLGSKRAGKTTYMTLTAHQLATGVGLPAGLTESCIISGDSERYFSYLIDCIRADKLPATKLSDDKDIIQVAFPLVISITPQQGLEPFFLVINDCPGEAMVNSIYLDNFRALSEVEGAIIMMDPCQFSETPMRKVDKDEMGHNVIDICDQSFNVTLSQFQQRMQEYRNLHKIVLALTKMDLIYGTGEGYLIKPGGYSHIDEPDLCSQHDGGIFLEWIDEMDFQVSGAIKKQLEYKDFEIKKSSLQDKQENLQITTLCCSTRKWQKGDKFLPIIYHSGDDRVVNMFGYRLLEPLLCIMGQCNWLPIKEKPPRRHKLLFWVNQTNN